MRREKKTTEKREDKKRRAGLFKKKERGRPSDKKSIDRKNKDKKRPQICLSLSCNTIEQLKSEIEEYREYCQMVEWCVDKTDGSKDYTEEEFKAILRDIKKLCREKKLIVDYKGDEETGNLIQRWSMGIADIIDVDADNTQIREMIREARRKKTKILVSHHLFDRMPERDEISTQFVKMERTGGDILKIACFAEKESQSYEILEAACAYTQLRNHKPIVAIAMGEEGQASRICAGDFGSVITYSCGTVPTAPGQFNAKDLSKYLDIYYERR